MNWWTTIGTPVIAGCIGGFIALMGRWLHNHDQLVILTTEMIELRANAARMEVRLEHLTKRDP